MENLHSKVGRLSVTSQVDAQVVCNKYDAVISIIDPEGDAVRVADGVRQLILPFHDITKPSSRWVAPSAHHVTAAIEFARQYQNAGLLLHCHAGISRSPAIALAIIADRFGAGNEKDAVEYLFAQYRIIYPNSRIISHADNVLNRNGALINAFRSKIKDVRAESEGKFIW